MAEAQATPTTTTAQSRYDQLATDRAPYLTRARECAALTVPHLMPPEGGSGSSELPTPYQSVGAEGVNHLGSKLVLALFPPGGSFFRLSLDAFVLEELAGKAEAGGIALEDARAEFDIALAKVERAVVVRMEQRGSRAGLYEALRQLGVTGNILIQVLADGGVRLHKLDSYVVKRDRQGNVLEIIVRESAARATLPPEVVAMLPEDSTGEKRGENVDVYTYILRESDKWSAWQEVNGQRIESTVGTYPLDKPAWLPLRWTKIDGEDYGRGIVEEYLGDLRSLEVLTKALVRFAAAATRILLFVSPSGVTAKEDIEQAETGDVVDGDARDVTILQLDKYADFQVAEAMKEKIEQRLSRRFLLHSSIQRNAERVTAEEIRLMAGELEQALGGVYSILAQELQRPLVVRLLAVMQSAGELPALPDGAVEPEIVAGLEGLGRSSDLNKLDMLLAGLQAAFGPEALAEYVNVGAYAKRRAAALGIDIEGLVRTEEEVQQARAAAAQRQMAEKLGPAAMSTATKVAEIQSQP